MRYEFIVKDAVESDVVVQLPGLRSTQYPTGGASLFGPLQDESEVQTLLARLGDLGLSVVEWRLLPD